MKLLLLPAYFTPELCSDTPLDDARYQAFADAGIEMDLYTPVPTRGISDDEKKIFDAYNGIGSISVLCKL